MQKPISFCISAENWLNADKSNILIIYDDIQINEGKIFYILSALISFHHSKKNDSIYEPISIYADLTSNYEKNWGLEINSDIKNNIRYLNYFSSMQKSFRQYQCFPPGVPTREYNDFSLVPIFQVRRKNILSPNLPVTPPP